jgi:asparaginyl-tRNA synthetase
MRVNDEGRTVAAIDVLAPGIGEIICGSMAERGTDREHCAATARCRTHLRPRPGFRRGGTLAYVTSLSTVRDAIPFPRTTGNARY